jgi:ribose/xylose/arabinose/galactoside ABC-type transport system permease subunit
MVDTRARRTREWTPGRSIECRGAVSAPSGTEGGALGRGRTLAPTIADALVGARFLPVWVATLVLLVVAAVIAPAALRSTSWAFVLPYMTILAVAALGQMLVIMQAGIDLSTAGVISLCGNVLVGVSANSDSRLALGILASVGVGTLVGLCNGILVAVVRLNPLIVTLATGQVALAWSVRYNREVAANPNVPDALSSWAGHKPLGISAVFWTGAALTLLVALALRERCTELRRCCSAGCASASIPLSGRPISSRRSPRSSSQGRRSREGWRARRRRGSPRWRSRS